MKKGIIVVIAEKENNELYQSLSLKEEIVVIDSLKDSIKSIPHDKGDLLLIDCGFDGNEGLKLLKTIKSTWPGMPVILLTDLKSENIAIEAFRIGVRGYYKKPVNIFELKDNIEKLLKIKRNSKEKRAPLERKLDATAELLGKVTSAIPSNLLRSVSYVEEHLSNPEGICLEKLAKEACLSKYHFCRIFKSTIGMSPMSFVEFMRVQRAKDLLARNDVRISAVVHYAGFNDFSNFTRKFKKYTGVTPSIYKATLNMNMK